MIWLTVAALCGALYGLHRLALWAEGRGWVYYLRRRASSDALGNAFLNLQKIVEPQAGHVVEVRQRERRSVALWGRQFCLQPAFSRPAPRSSPRPTYSTTL